MAGKTLYDKLWESHQKYLREKCGDRLVRTNRTIEEVRSASERLHRLHTDFHLQRGVFKPLEGKDLKGLEEAVEIYEVVDKRRRAPVPPINGRRKSRLLPVWLALGVFLVGAALVYGIMRYQRTEVYFANWGPELTIVDQKQPLALIGVRSQESQLAVTPLPVGRHLLHQDISARMRNYMEVKIKRGLNVIAPEMSTVYMPTLKRRLDFHAGRREEVEAFLGGAMCPVPGAYARTVKFFVPQKADAAPAAGA